MTLKDPSWTTSLLGTGTWLVLRNFLWYKGFAEALHPWLLREILLWWSRGWRDYYNLMDIDHARAPADPHKLASKGFTMCMEVTENFRDWYRISGLENFMAGDSELTENFRAWYRISGLENFMAGDSW